NGCLSAASFRHARPYREAQEPAGKHGLPFSLVRFLIRGIHASHPSGASGVQICSRQICGHAKEMNARGSVPIHEINKSLKIGIPQQLAIVLPFVST
ncbi:hypothetical protein, partial [Methylophaga lonarensis]|uniref:hypothetical protein n=1 Tax=Methylophaga lonarensis TaxID=999151 RepID=UPI001F204E79